MKIKSTSLAYWLSILIAVSLWMADSLFAYLWFNETGEIFLKFLMPLNNGHEMLQRFFYTLTILLCGLVVARIFEQVVAGQLETARLRNYLNNIIDSMPSVLIGIDTDCQITFWNREAGKMTGISSSNALGRDLFKIFPEIEPQKKKIDRSIKLKRSFIDRKMPFISVAGEDMRYRDVMLFPLVGDGLEGAVLRLTDVTEQVRLEEIMVQSEKMLSVGGLAAGMAHEINNPLAGMMQTANVMASRLDPATELPANLKAAEEAGTTMEAIGLFMESRGINRMIGNIIKSGKRLADIVNNMLSFARKTGDHKSTHRLSELIDHTIDLAGTDYDLKKQHDFKHIKIIREYDETVPPVPCEKGKIQQVLLNIFRNGAEAMQEAGTPDPSFFVSTYVDESCGCSCMEIENNGPGMSEEVRSRVFEPFFTTKPVGKGTGLGMSVSYFIMRNIHGGDILVESNPAGGVKFTVRLPLVGGDSITSSDIP